MKVLVVDDELAVRAFLRKALECRGHDVESADSGEAAIERWSDAAPDVVLLDLMMPGIDGIETAAVLRDAGYGGPILLFSGYLTPDVMTRAHEMGLVPISKVDTEALYRVIGALAGEITAFRPPVIAGVQ